MDGSWKPIQLIQLTLKNNQVIEHTRQLTSSLAGQKITPRPIESNVESAAYTVTGLFDLAQSLVSSNWTEEETRFYIDFDSNYNFPAKITFESNKYTDIQQIWEVKLFKRL